MVLARLLETLILSNLIIQKLIIFLSNPGTEGQNAKYSISCASKGCLSNNSIEKMKFIRFPEDTELHQQWINLLQVTQEEGRMFACMQHFDKQIFERKSFKDILPSVNLPQSGEYVVLILLL